MHAVVAITTKKSTLEELSKGIVNKRSFFVLIAKRCGGC